MSGAILTGAHFVMRKSLSIPRELSMSLTAPKIPITKVGATLAFYINLNLFSKYHIFVVSCKKILVSSSFG